MPHTREPANALLKHNTCMALALKTCIVFLFNVPLWSTAFQEIPLDSEAAVLIAAVTSCCCCCCCCWWWFKAVRRFWLFTAAAISWFRCSIWGLISQLLLWYSSCFFKAAKSARSLSDAAVSRSFSHLSWFTWHSENKAKIEQYYKKAQNKHTRTSAKSCSFGPRNRIIFNRGF